MAELLSIQIATPDALLVLQVIVDVHVVCPTGIVQGLGLALILPEGAVVGVGVAVVVVVGVELETVKV